MKYLHNMCINFIEHTHKFIQQEKTNIKHYIRVEILLLKYGFNYHC